MRFPIAAPAHFFVVSAILTGRLIAADEVDPERERFFESQVRPLLMEHCASCHGDKKQSAGLRVDSLPSLLKGGDSGPAIIPSQPAKSLLLAAVRRDGELQMPPDQTLDNRAIATLRKWIEIGAPWPGGGAADVEPSDRANEHWAFHAVVQPEVPKVSDDSNWIASPLDAFVLQKLHERGLQPSASAGRRTLIRRVTYALTGLPPDPLEVDAFVDNDDPDAYERLVDRLIASPEYGEHAARQWLDVARYSDTKGYVYAREERHWVHAWAFRDWVTSALGQDMPYDRFLLLQMAADQVEDRRREDLAAMGFLTVGRRFLGVQRDIIDDRIDVVSRGMMGLTVGCARCHDHKYDPIPTADYYSLYGVFHSCMEQLERLGDSLGDDAAFESGLKERETKYEEKYAEHLKASSDRVRARVADYLFAQTQLDQFPANGFDQIFYDDDLLPAFVRRWQRYLRMAKSNSDPIFLAWHAFFEIPASEFAQRAVDVTRRLNAAPHSMHPLVAKAFAEPPVSFREVCDRYGEIFAEVDRQWQQTVAEASEAGTKTPAQLPHSEAESMRKVLYGPLAPCQVPRGPISHTETYFSSDACTELWKLRGEIDRWINKASRPMPYALTLVDQATPIEPRIFRRGNPLSLGKDVPRQFLSVISGTPQRPFRRGSGRYELARAIVDPGNPLTARVIVNRVWLRMMGSGLVATPSDFGTRAGAPSHPELLDWLAAELVDDGWSLKKLHRKIVTSATFRQSSRGPIESDAFKRAMKIDPDNRMLWRMNARRLTFEEFRDSLLAAAGDLDRRPGGKPASLFDRPYPTRRSLYGKVDRQYLPGTLRVFDFANPDLHVAKRTETTVPQQALFFLNDPMILDRSRRLAEACSGKVERRTRAIEMFRRTYQRPPSESEIRDAMSLVAAADAAADPQTRSTAGDWSYGFGVMKEADNRLFGFTPLPHFTGTAWQGGAEYPDGRLGWVQLTADGGHPGNDLEHAAVRRWTAPSAMTIRIRSTLVHEPKAGDGIRVFVVSSVGGIHHKKTIHQAESALNVDSLDVGAGDTVDFVVDIGKVLNNDQYLWRATIEASESATIWDSKLDFPPRPVEKLDGWEQLAQVMLCANEFMFVD